MAQVPLLRLGPRARPMESREGPCACTRPCPKTARPRYWPARDPMQQGPRGCMQQGPWGPMQQGPRGPMQQGPQGPMQQGPRGSMQQGPRGPMQQGPRGSMQQGPRGSMQQGPRGPMQQGPRGPIQEIGRALEQSTAPKPDAPGRAMTRAHAGGDGQATAAIPSMPRDGCHPSHAVDAIRAPSPSCLQAARSPNVTAIGTH
jgi:hypothetical protein